MPRSFRVHRPTVILLALVAGLFLWLNLRPTDHQERLNLLPPRELDPLTRRLFYRGWPLSPFLVCEYRGMKWHPEESFCQSALLLDAGAVLSVLVALGCACEWWMRRQRTDERTIRALITRNGGEKVDFSKPG
jgi:hypothetical protein